MFDIYFNGKAASDIGLLVVQRPNYVTPEENINTWEIPGRVSDLHQRTGRFGTASIQVTFNYAVPPDQWGEVWRQAYLWLRGSGEYQQSDDMDVYRNVLYVTIGENERKVRRVGTFTATFVCAPGEFYVSGKEYTEASELAASYGLTESMNAFSCVINNKYSKCRPIYAIRNQQTSASSTVKISVNGNTGMELDMDDSSIVVVIDTERKITYTELGENANTWISGDYDDLILEQGENDIEASSTSIVTPYAKTLELYIRPNWVVI